MADELKSTADDLESDFGELTDAKAEEHPAFPAFLKQMRGRCYGHEALNDAWAWFREGWAAARAALLSDAAITAGVKAWAGADGNYLDNGILKILEAALRATEKPPSCDQSGPHIHYSKRLDEHTGEPLFDRVPCPRATERKS